jgi:hypothetical protein
VYPFGLLVLVATAWLAAFLSWPDALGLERWWASLSAVLLATAGWFGLRWLLPWWTNHQEQTGWVSALAKPLGRLLNSLLRLDWLYRLGAWLYLLVQRWIQSLTAILEGEGGVLWVLVLLALLVSLMQTSGTGGAP